MGRQTVRESEMEIDHHLERLRTLVKREAYCLTHEVYEADHPTLKDATLPQTTGIEQDSICGR